MAKLALLGGTPVLGDPPPLPRLYEERPLAERLASYVGSRYALTAASGTGALVSALLGVGVEPGDEVVTVAHTWFCTATSILAVGAVPVFVDVDPRTFTLDPALIAERVTPRTRAVLAVSLYGHPARYDQIATVAAELGLAVIDDACQATGAALLGRKLGSWGDVTAFSFSGKPLVSSGGGAITTDERTIWERAMLAGQHPSFISTHALDPGVHALAPTGGYGANNRIDGFCAERAYAELEQLDSSNDARRRNARRLADRLASVPGMTPPAPEPEVHHVYHMLTTLFDGADLGIERDELLAALVAEGLPAMAYVAGGNFLKGLDGNAWAPGPLHRRPLFQQLAAEGRAGPFVLPSGARPDYSAGSLPVTERLAAAEWNLPQRWLGAPFGDERMDAYADAVEKVVEHAGELRDARARGALPAPRHHFLTSGESDA